MSTEELGYAVRRLSPNSIDPDIGCEQESMPESAMPLITTYWYGERGLLPPKWLVDEILPSGSSCILLGESGAGKSFIAVHLASCAARGEPFFGKPVQCGGTLLIPAEAPDVVHERLKGELGKFDAENEPSWPIAVSNEPSLDLGCEDGVARLIKTANEKSREMEERFGVPLRLIIIDTLLAAFRIDDWNRQADAQEVNRHLQRVARETGATVLAVAHVGKDATRGLAGSFAFTAAADVILLVNGKKMEDGQMRSRMVCVQKTRRGAASWKREFDIGPVSVTCVDGSVLNTGIVLPGEAPPVRTSSSSEECLLETLRDTLSNASEMNLPSHGAVRVARLSDVKQNFSDRYRRIVGATADAARKAWERVAKKHRGGHFELEEHEGEEWVLEVNNAAGGNTVH